MSCLSREQEKAFVERLRVLTSGKKSWFCQFCEAQNSYHTRLVYALPSYKVDLEKGSLVDPEGPVMPVVALICQHCGYVHFFSAVIAGTLDESLGVK